MIAKNCSGGKLSFVLPIGKSINAEHTSAFQENDLVTGLTFNNHRVTSFAHLFQFAYRYILAVFRKPIGALYCIRKFLVPKVT